MARCDVASARAAGVDCRVFYRLQAQVADQVRVFRGKLRGLAAVLQRHERLGSQDLAAISRLEKYMGKGAGGEHDKVGLVYNVLTNAELQLRNVAALATFDKSKGADAEAQVGSMIFGGKFDSNTILHEALHFGTQVWRSKGPVPYIRDG